MLNPFLGVTFHWVGGLAAASFYVPYKRVRGWSWEVLWIVGGVFSWIIAPWLFAFWRTPDLFAILAAIPTRAAILCFGFGALWGFGGLTYGLAVRYLGISLGTTMVLGFTMVLGTLIPPLVNGRLLAMLPSFGGQLVLGGIAVCILGTIVVGSAGQLRERESSSGPATAVQVRRGLGIAFFSGVMSSCFAFGLAAGEPIRALALAHGTSTLSQGLPVLIVILLGGFTTNVLWCGYLIARNRSGRELTGKQLTGQPSEEAAAGSADPLLRNYGLCALGGTIWYFQFFFYTMGASQMGRYGFSSWSLHMASIIIFASFWGLALREWKGTSFRARGRLIAGVAMLVVATVIIGFGNSYS